MTREEVLEKIRQVIRDSVPEMVTEDLKEDTVINTETAIDSMGFILVICKLEAMFDVRIPSGSGRSCPPWAMWPTPS